MRGIFTRTSPCHTVIPCDCLRRSRTFPRRRALRSWGPATRYRVLRPRHGESGPTTPTGRRPAPRGDRRWADESTVDSKDPRMLSGTLARMKAEATASRLAKPNGKAARFILGCDSVLGRGRSSASRPATPRRPPAGCGCGGNWRPVHRPLLDADVLQRAAGRRGHQHRGALADVSDAEIAAYGHREPLNVAGAFNSRLPGWLVRRADRRRPRHGHRRVAARPAPSARGARHLHRRPGPSPVDPGPWPPAAATVLGRTARQDFAAGELTSGPEDGEHGDQQFLPHPVAPSRCRRRTSATAPSTAQETGFQSATRRSHARANVSGSRMPDSRQERAGPPCSSTGASVLALHLQRHAEGDRRGHQSDEGQQQVRQQQVPDVNLAGRTPTRAA